MSDINKRRTFIVLALAVVTIATVSVQSAQAQTAGIPGWGNRTSNQFVVGPSGISVRPEFTQRLENRRDRIVNRLESNNRIPEPQKSNVINQVQSLFDRLLNMFS